MYHKETIETLQDSVLDLVDYTQRQALRLIAWNHDVAALQPKAAKELVALSGQEQVRIIRCACACVRACVCVCVHFFLVHTSMCFLSYQAAGGSDQISPL